MSAVDDRRQRAREAGWDAADLRDHTEVPNIETAIETATRVKITPEIQAAIYGHETDEEALAAAFRAAGFEVEE